MTNVRIECPSGGQLLKLLIGIRLACCLLSAADASVSEREIQRRFVSEVKPFLSDYCVSCHGPEKQKGKFDLRPLLSPDSLSQNPRQWETILSRLKASDMPPEEAPRHPDSKPRTAVIHWIESARTHEARKNAGDPGPVIARRLSNAEYNHTIRDLTGVDIQPAKEFPVDPANEAGFDNSGESLTVSPALVAKQLDAARRISEHIVFTPNGLEFAPHPVVTETDRDKYCVKRIVDFYRSQPTELANYFQAAWRFKHSTALHHKRLSITEIARVEKLSPKYLNLIWQIVAGENDNSGPIREIRTRFRSLPDPRAEPGTIRAACQELGTFVNDMRLQLVPEVQNLAVRGIASGSQPFVLWKDRQMAANRRAFNPATIEKSTNPILKFPSDPALHPAHEASLKLFCSSFPDAFYVQERVLVFLKEDKESRGRLLSAGFHLMTGYFRDDAPLGELILDDSDRAKLDELWNEFHFVTGDLTRQYKDFIFFERAEPPRFMQGSEFDFARSEDKSSSSVEKMEHLAKLYLEKATRNGGGTQALAAIEDFFKSMSKEIRWIESLRLKAEPKQLESALDFAQRACRRTLLKNERDELITFYQTLRSTGELGHEEAIRDLIASIIMSPQFFYHQESASLEASSSHFKKQQPRSGRWPVERIPDVDLASRLSYFLWASLPDDELLSHARKGKLHQPGVLKSQAARMIKDDRIRSLALEFGGNWLDIRRFEEHNAVDRQRFSSFNNELRSAMFEEPLRFFVSVAQENRSILDFIQARDTYVNQPLAKHYGMDEIHFTSDAWQHVLQADKYGRGGLLPMSVFLTRNSPGLRTSPVKRGYWVIRSLLGEKVPPPPPKVPELPADEGDLGALNLRETLARHRADKSCAGCHDRFDAIGLALEGYGPIGEHRTLDLGGRPVDAHAAFPGGTEGNGLDGLRGYLREKRQNEFVENFCRKLLAYALGRSLIPSDDLLIDDLRTRLARNEFRFAVLVDGIITSPQFLNRRLSPE